MIHFRRIPARDPRLRRNVYHDDESRRYPFRTAGLTLVSTKHTRRIPTLDQLRLGCCTGDAGVSALGTDPFWTTLTAVQQGLCTQPGAIALYSAATLLDDVRGQYPPTDTGSSGLAVAKALKADGRINGYTHTFTLDDALLALTVTPVITGMNWYHPMFTPDADGRVHPTGAVDGGHEIVADEVDVENERVWFTNSWGDWGAVRDGWTGRFYMTFTDYGTVLAQDGDVTVFVPRTAPAPTPVPVPPPVPPVPPNPVPVPADVVLTAALRKETTWLNTQRWGASSRVAAACLAFLKTAPAAGGASDEPQELTI